MKKRLIGVVLAVVIALVMAPLALATTHTGHPAKTHKAHKAHKVAKAKPFLCTGAVVSADPTSGTLVVTVAKGSRSIRPYVGTDVTFTLTKNVRLVARTAGASPAGYVAVTLDQLTAGVPVHINGRIDNSVPDTSTFFARLVKATLAPTPTPTPTTPPTPAPTPGA